MNYFMSISYTISHIFLFLFMYLFIVHRFSKKVTALICFCSFLFLSISDYWKLIVYPDSDLCYVVITILQILVTQFTAIFISRNKNSQVVFIGLSDSSYVIAGSVVATVLQICIKNMIVALLGGFVVHSVILLFLWKKVQEICLKFQEKKHMKSYWMLCWIPVFFYCSFCFIAFFPTTLYDNPDNILGSLFLVLTMLISYILVIRYVESESKKSVVYWKNMLLESYIKGLENQQFWVEQAEQNLKILHHDVRHYSQIINSLLEEENYDEIRKVTEHINNVADESKMKKYCNNLIVNTIISNMMERANSYEIVVHHDIIVPKEIPVNDYECTLVIANLFENAINCVKDFEKAERYIDVKIHCVQNYLLIQMRNAFQEEIVLDSVTRLPKSKKKGNHGLGMQSILAFSEKIGGTVGCYLEDNIFQIMMFAKF